LKTPAGDIVTDNEQTEICFKNATENKWIDYQYYSECLQAQRFRECFFAKSDAGTSQCLKQIRFSEYQFQDVISDCRYSKEDGVFYY
jgi:hypothetical protein